MSEQNTPFEMADPANEKEPATAAPAEIVAPAPVVPPPAPVAPHNPTRPVVNAGATARASVPMSKVAAMPKQDTTAGVQVEPKKRDTTGETFKHIKDAGTNGCTVNDLVKATKRDQREVQADVNQLKGKGSIEALSDRRPVGDNMEPVWVAAKSGEQHPDAPPLPVHKSN